MSNAIIIKQLKATAKANADLEPKLLNKKLKGFLLFKYGLEGKAATAILKEAGFSSQISTGFAASFYQELREGPMSDERFNEVIAAGSKNIQNHKAHYNGIRTLANDVWAAK